MLKTGEACDGVAHLEERARTGIALVAHHHRRPLAVAHRAGTRVGEKVDIYLVGRELKNIVVCGTYPLLALGTSTLADRLYHLDAP